MDELVHRLVAEIRNTYHVLRLLEYSVDVVFGFPDSGDTSFIISKPFFERIPQFGEERRIRGVLLYLTE